MIQCQQMPLNPARRSQLLRWLNQPEAAILFEQLRMLAANEQVKASELLISSIDVPGDAPVATLHAKSCRFYEDVALLLEKMAVAMDNGESEFDFITVELNPITLTLSPNEQ